MSSKLERLGEFIRESGLNVLIDTSLPNGEEFVVQFCDGQDVLSEGRSKHIECALLNAAEAARGRLP